MSDVSKYTSCREIFKDYSILIVACLYILDVAYYIKKHKKSLEKEMHKFTNMIRKEKWIYMFISAIRFFSEKV